MSPNRFFPALLAILLPSCAATTEKPDYEVLEKDGKCELRQYADIPVASAPMAGMNQRNDSFRTLFRYISGDNAQQEKISMTSPVFMESSPKDKAAANSGTMSFMIPSEIAKKGTPKPDSNKVAIRNITGGTIATIRFKGWRNEDKRTAAVKQLEQWATKKGWKAKGKPFFAFYNPPWTPEILRRNEVWLHVDAGKQSKQDD